MSNVLENPDQRAQDRISDLFLFAIFLDIHIFFANAIGRIFLGQSSLDTLLVYAILALLAVRAFPYIFAKKVSATYSAFVIAVLLFMTLSVALNTELDAKVYSGVIRTAYIAVLVGSLLGSAVTDFEILEAKLRKIGPVLALEMIVSFYIYHFVFKTEWGTGAMGLSYRLLVPAVLMLYSLFRKFNILELLLFAVLFAIMLLQGSRGPLVAVVIFAVLYQLINLSENRRRVYINIGILIAVTVVFFVNLDRVLKWIVALCSKYGFYSKFLRVMLDGNFFEANGRDEVAAGVREIIAGNPFGNGFFAERPIINTYCHNIFLEFLVDFGVVFGSVLSVLFVGYLFRKLRSKNVVEKNVICILLCAFLVKLLFSNSFWVEPVFFAFLRFITRQNQPVASTRVTEVEAVPKHETNPDYQY